jgi:FkbM family methyltransferase
MLNKDKLKVYRQYLLSRTIYTCVPIYNFNWIRSKLFYSKILGSLTIKFVDIGARQGSSQELQPLEDHIEYVGFEADRLEVERLNSAQHKYRSARFIEAFVGGKEEDVQFNLYNQRGASSVFHQNQSFNKWFAGGAQGYIDKTITMKAFPLDSLLKDADLDFLKIDTQGNEYEILEGSTNCLSSILMLEAEVEFYALYEGQKLAHDIIGLMHQKGFDLLYLNRVFGSSRSFKGSSRGQLVFGDALFGLSRERALGLDLDKQIKYCVLLINYGLIDFAYDIYANSQILRDNCLALGEFFEASNRQPKLQYRFRSFLDKVIFVLLSVRGTNGLTADSDRSWPIR